MASSSCSYLLYRKTRTQTVKVAEDTVLSASRKEMSSSSRGDHLRGPRQQLRALVHLNLQWFPTGDEMRKGRGRGRKRQRAAEVGSMKPQMQARGAVDRREKVGIEKEEGAEGRSGMRQRIGGRSMCTAVRGATAIGITDLGGLGHTMSGRSDVGTGKVARGTGATPGGREAGGAAERAAGAEAGAVDGCNSAEKSVE